MNQMEKQDMKAIISKLVDRLKEQYQPEKIILYGSYAYGSPDKESDIDLLIIKDTSERPIDRRITVRRLISDIRNKMPFSSLVLTPDEISHYLAIGDDFLKEITNKGLILYER
jgi:predicted nucleotidyltransferase